MRQERKLEPSRKADIRGNARTANCDPLRTLLSCGDPQFQGTETEAALEHEIEMRRGAGPDAAAIRDLTRAAYAKWVPAIGREPKPMSADYEIAIQNNRFDLLYIDGTLAALIETIDQGDSLLIENVAVAPAFQRRGLGSKLMRHAEEVARSLGYDRIWLYTNRRFAGNIELYTSLGYGVDTEEPIDAGMVRTNMSKRFSSDGTE